MIAKNNSYFDIELCLDGHYIVTGYTNDQYCNDMLQLSDIKYELHRYLRHEQGFDAVFFLDSVNMLFCYDQQSYDILRGNYSRAEKVNNNIRTGEEIISTTPLGHRRRRRTDNRPPLNNNPVSTAPQNNTNDSPLHMGRQAIDSSWEQVTTLLRSSEHRCALILSNVDSLISSMGVHEMAILEELQSYHSSNHSIVVYIFRDTSITTLIESVGRSLGGASNQWARFVQNVLLSRIETGSPETNRVISLRTPNSSEIKNLLNFLRFRHDSNFRVSPGDIQPLSEILASSCARQKWGLGQLLTRLERCSSDNPERVLTVGNWREFTGEINYLPPMQQLDRLVGMNDLLDSDGNVIKKGVKTDIKEWYAHQQQNSVKDRKNISFSRFAPVAKNIKLKGHVLNIRLKGNPGTGKTTVARLMGMLYYELGLLPQGQLIECTASDLVSQYVGDTARLVRERVQEAMGGVLFIDEAYSLTTNQHGIEAINQLVSDMSTYEGQFAVVIAGYPNEIDRMMRENDGLARRFPVEYVLPDYTADEMLQILKLNAANDSRKIVFSKKFEDILPTFCEAWVGGRTRGWGNAGEAETLLTAMKKRCSVRMAVNNIISDTMELDIEDIPDNLRYCLSPKSKSLEEALEKTDKLIGLKNVKKFLKELSRNILWGAEEKAPGNYIFSGAPGTGKTTVARKMGEILGHLGVLRRKVNNVTECKAADLLNGSVNLNDIVDDARGGILFIDEAHQLEQNERGHSIIRALVPIIEDPEIRSDTCFICAGYTSEMNRFLNVDAGLSRRFPVNHRIRFDDYSASELVMILKDMADAKGEITEEGYLERSYNALNTFLEHKPENFGNGGFIRDVYLPGSIAARTLRMNREITGDENSIVSKNQVEKISAERRRTLTALDIPRSFESIAGPVGKKIPQENSPRRMLSELYGKEPLVNYVLSKYTKDENEVFFDSVSEVGMCYSIAGPVGTGRHLSVKIVSAAFYELGLLEKDEVIFAGKADFEAGYVGQTAIKTRTVIEKAMGGTLAVTNPSAMLPRNSHDNSFGTEALGVIAGAMAKHFNDLCVVFIDTVEGMEMLFKSFPSIRSCLQQQFVYEDLMPEDMLNIFRLKTRESICFDRKTESLLPDFFLNWGSDKGGLGESSKSWGNGKEIDKFISELIQNWKCSKDRKTTSTFVEEKGRRYTLKRRYITPEMFPKELRKYLSSNRVISETALQELDKMTGLQSVKKSIKAIERRFRRMSSENVIPGLYCYLGNPGVGKTTVAKLMGGILKASGAVSQGHVIIRTARQMSENTDEFNNTIKLAKNGVLFIDEAHQLADPVNPNGRIVIKKLLTVLEDVDIVKNTCIILAGYPYDMKMLFRADSGLKSRFGTADSIINFEDYTPSELLSILDDMCSKANLIPQIGSSYPLRTSSEYREISLNVFKLVVLSGNKEFGNARFVRNYIHDSLDMLLERIDEEYGTENDPPNGVIDLLTEKDIPLKYKNVAKIKKESVLLDSSLIRTDGMHINLDNVSENIESLSQNVVLIETFTNGTKTGEGTGSIITSDGFVLTCAHVVRGCDKVRARVYSPGMAGGNYRWFECSVSEPVIKECDMALIKMNGVNFHNISVRPAENEIKHGEETILIGYPLGTMLTGNNINELSASVFMGRIASAQSVNGIQRYYIDSTGLHGNSGSPVISADDGNMIGVFSGSVIPDKNSTLDELNYFYPISYFWKNYIKKEDSDD
ncbi:MAG TPA: hypothetical protein DCG30_08320 [Ruminococcus sp.]|nr:hypothetical protein [Ruminococcus sp.]